MHTDLSNDPIVIVGMSCRFPGASTPEAFWNLLQSGKSMIREVPYERWEIEKIYNPDAKIPGKAVTKWGSFIDNVDLFDNDFFITPTDEAERVDPQQRLMLELSWEALENANINPQKLSGTYTGVYIGVSHSDYERIVYRQLEGVVGHDGPGCYQALTANRISYFLNLKGPSVVVDTACSSSLSALNSAVAALQTNDINIAIVGGVNLNLTPEETIGLTKAGLLSPRGLCSSFAEDADGYVRGEGAGAVIICKLSYAKEHHLSPLCKILAVAMNQDGRSNGILAPSGIAQRELINRTLHKANLIAEDISYVEAHGTGTYIGDLIEYKALNSTYGDLTNRKEKCLVATLKTNIGHLESASGIASLIKVALCLNKKQIPPHLNFNKLNTKINADTTGLRIPTSKEKWDTYTNTRKAAISAFGFGGTNCHVIAEEFIENNNEKNSEEQNNIVLISAHNSQALQDRISNFVHWLHAHSDISTSDFCMNANIGKAIFAERAVYCFKDLIDLQEQLTQNVDRTQQSLKKRNLCIDLSMDHAWSDTDKNNLFSHPLFREVHKDLNLFTESEKYPRNAQQIFNDYFNQLLQIQQNLLYSYFFYKIISNTGIVPQAYIYSEKECMLFECLTGKITLAEALENSLSVTGNIATQRISVPGKSEIDFTESELEAVLSDQKITVICSDAFQETDTIKIIRVEKHSRLIDKVFPILKQCLEFGWDIDFTKLYADKTIHPIELPAYPYQRKSFWIKPVVEESEVARYPLYHQPTYQLENE